MSSPLIVMFFIVLPLQLTVVSFCAHRAYKTKMMGWFVVFLFFIVLSVYELAHYGVQYAGGKL